MITKNSNTVETKTGRRGRRGIYNRTTKRTAELNPETTWAVRGVEVSAALDEMAQTMGRDAMRLEAEGDYKKAGLAERMSGQFALMAQKAREDFANGES